MTVSFARAQTDAPPPEKRSKVETILFVARQEFARGGYRAVTIRAVAEKAEVSTRTLYNHFTDKLGLFTACIREGAATFPDPGLAPAGEPAQVLRDYAIAIVKHLSADPSRQLSQIIARDGEEFPEIIEPIRANAERYLLKPLSTYLRNIGIAPGQAVNLAHLFNHMATSEWRRRLMFRESPLSNSEIEAHVDLAVGVFLNGLEAHWSDETHAKPRRNTDC